MTKETHTTKRDPHTTQIDAFTKTDTQTTKRDAIIKRDLASGHKDDSTLHFRHIFKRLPALGHLQQYANSMPNVKTNTVCQMSKQTSPAKCQNKRLLQQHSKCQNKRLHAQGALYCLTPCHHHLSLLIISHVLSSLTYTVFSCPSLTYTCRGQPRATKALVVLRVGALSLVEVLVGCAQMAATHASASRALSLHCRDTTSGAHSLQRRDTASGVHMKESGDESRWTTITSPLPFAAPVCVCVCLYVCVCVMCKMFINNRTS